MKIIFSTLLVFFSLNLFSQPYSANGNEKDVIGIIDSIYNYGFKKTFYIIPLEDKTWESLKLYMDSYENNTWDKVIDGDDDLNANDLKYKAKKGIHIVSADTFSMPLLLKVKFPSFRNVMLLYVSYKATFIRGENSIQIIFDDYQYHHYDYAGEVLTAITPLLGHSKPEGKISELLHSKLNENEKHSISIELEAQAATHMLMVYRQLKKLP